MAWHSSIDPADPSFPLVDPWHRLVSYFEVPLALPINDIFLCPPVTNQAFKPRNFETPEAEETWWSDPTTWPGDDLVRPTESPLLSSMRDNDDVPRRTFVPLGPDEPFVSDDEDVNEGNSQTSPLPFRPALDQARNLVATPTAGPSNATRSDPVAFGSPAGDTRLANFEFTAPARTSPAPPYPSPPPTSPSEDAENEEMECFFRDEEQDLYCISDDDDDSEQDWSDAPPHHARAPPVQRARTPTPSTSKPPRTHKPQTKKAKRSAVMPAQDGRRPPECISPEQLASIHSQLAHLKESKEPAPVFHLQHPSKTSGRQAFPWICAVEDCKHSSARKAEAQRHALVHTGLRRLCCNPQCNIIFSRDDAVARHVKETACKKNLPPGVTAKTETARIVREGDCVRVVRLEWVGEVENASEGRQVGRKGRKMKKSA